MRKYLFVVLSLFAVLFISLNVVSAQVIDRQGGVLTTKLNLGQETGDIVSKILIGPDGKKILLETSPSANVTTNYLLPEDISKNYQEVEFNGYLIELKQSPLLEIRAKRESLLREKIAPLDKSLEKAANEKERETIKKQIDDLIRSEAVAVKPLILNQKIVIQKEQAQAELDIKNLAPKIKIKRKFSKAFNGFSVKDITEKEVQSLRNKGYKVWPNIKARADLMDSVPLINANQIWSMTDDQNRFVTGQGIRIGIIDTGIDFTHPDLGGCLGASCKVAGGYDFVNNDNNPYDDYGHGTHVAAIAAGDGALRGVAPNASLYALKVCDAFGSCPTDVIIAGIEWAVDPNQDEDFSDRLDVINLSLGGWGYPDDLLSSAIDRAVGNGIVAVVSAGNNGPSSQSISTPGTARKAITVAASDKQDKIAYFSSRGPVIWNNQSIIKPDITAPGVAICAAQASNNWLSYRECLDSTHISIDGTSMAAPHIAGAAALLKQQHPYWSPDSIKYVLRNAALKFPGYSALEQGIGRIDILKSALLSRPLIAVLNPISTIKTGTISISGELSIGSLSASDFQQYTLSYASLGSDGFTTLTSTNTFPVLGKFAYSLNLSNIPDGKYIVKLSVKDIYNREAIDYGYFEVEKFEITSPLDGDIYRAGWTIGLGAKGMSTNSTLQWYFSLDSITWIAISSSFWNTNGLPNGIYYLKATLTTGSFIENKIVKVYLDNALRAISWPKRIDWEKGSCLSGEECYYWAGYLEPVVSDLDNNGYKEIVVLKGGKPPKLMVYDDIGILRWSANVGTQAVAGGNLGMPIIGDINNDGKKEIFVINPAIEDFTSTSSELYAFQSNGLPLNSWPQPVKIPKMYTGYMLMADLNFDGNKEIVIKSSSWQKETIVLNSNGGIISRIPLLYNPTASWGAMIESTPAVGNFDNDKDLEIVVADLSENAGPIFENNQFKGYNNEGIIYVFNLDGSLVSGWPVRTPGVIFSSPAVGDINQDGNDEIIIGLYYASDIYPDARYGGIYVFGRNGNILPGWPQFKGIQFMSAPSLGEMDGDNGLEIAISATGPYTTDIQTYLFNYDGTITPNWPKKTSWVNWFSTIVGDANGDKYSDVLAAAGSYWYGGGGVYAWQANGQLISGFPKATETDAQAPAVIFDINRDDKLELITSSDWDYNFQTGKFKNRGSLYVWDLINNISDPKTLQWPTFMRDEQRTGNYYSSPTLTVDPASTSTLIGKTVKFTAFYDPDGVGAESAINVTASTIWSSASTSIATINSSGVASALKFGTTTINALYGKLVVLLSRAKLTVGKEVVWPSSNVKRNFTVYDLCRNTWYTTSNHSFTLPPGSNYVTGEVGDDTVINLINGTYKSGEVRVTLSANGQSCSNTKTTGANNRAKCTINFSSPLQASSSALISAAFRVTDSAGTCSSDYVVNYDYNCNGICGILARYPLYPLDSSASALAGVIPPQNLWQQEQSKTYAISSSQMANILESAKSTLINILNFLKNR